MRFAFLIFLSNTTAAHCVIETDHGVCMHADSDKSQPTVLLKLKQTAPNWMVRPMVLVFIYRAAITAKN